ncbi:MAG: DUF3467 domain-containing protein [Elusimicrobiales bacterium]|jgi:hypothetical protein|nr:DUF3467 domain-containing protein [Elusimicrobiales bacterium]HOL61833.1 DUF3467 domain-containing protein [Elusimicrobiales bacterium]HPO94585.1 DUF3467 domain-containing protein [Elusimicrobiales bacterium]
MSEKKQEGQLQIEIQIDEATAQGIYTNLAGITHSETEFIFDFLFIQPNQPKAKLRARIISNPIHTKRFLQALVENIRKYEERFGKIPERDYTVGGHS